MGKEKFKENFQQQNYIKGKLYKLNELMLLELRNTEPDKLQIENTIYNIKSWAELCKYTVEWLIKEGVINKYNIPIFTSGQNDKYFINSKPVHFNSERNAQWIKVNDYFN